MLRKIALHIIVALFIFLWIYTGINKVLDFANFKFQLGRSPFIEHLAGVIAIAIPAGELSLAGLFLFKRMRLLALFASFVLMALFTGYIWLMLNYASDLPCSCGGVLAQLSWDDHLIFNSIFTVLALLGIILHATNNPGPYVKSPA